MRTEKEMFELILRYARENEDVRAVILNGSRANPNAKKDPFQDYDIVYLVTQMAPYKRNMEIVRYFGDILILQTPDDMGEGEHRDFDGYGYLMQFMDGTRIDLGFYPLEAAQTCVADSQTILLLDKDGRFGTLPPPSDHDYLPQKPTAKAFDDCCNEFWWVTPYVAKGLWRDELTYAKYMLDNVVRDQLMKMLTWYFGVKTDFQKSPGKQGKYLRGTLDEEDWAMLERTYADADPEHTWQALFVMGDLFRKVAQVVADSFGLAYPGQDDRNVSAFLRRIRDLPQDAETL
ncbi:MAG: aminoglycoside 6-adenylyltransferase [Anaerolineales bacterium]|nr:aminoglycoside 6-adenylyltransferase [Anaerolineales bacterium]